jgi:CheY-like chemotaxis protein
MKILIAEDSETNRETLGRFFSVLGHEVIKAQDGKEAIEKLEQNCDIDLLISDFHMPYFEGDEVIKRAKRARADLPCVLISAFSDEAKEKFEKKLKYCSRCFCFQKPVDIEMVVKRLKEVGVDIWKPKS